ncbi:hypothetical protein GCM10023187_23810 [Nibrella viscosa]|uniref:TonB C-terminal domain-containing protein n=1 Tax=Nibrella viscosa TaxID=1084524 RepID=A0ABP8KF78_9BACT
MATDEVVAYVAMNNTAFFPGGPLALKAYLKQTALYPAQARKSMQEGTVLVQFRIGAGGELSEIQVVRSAGTLLDRAAIQTIAQMPKWHPAHRSGMAVSSLMILPITFRID